MKTKQLLKANLRSLGLANPQQPVEPPTPASDLVELPARRFPPAISVLRHTCQWALISFLAFAAYWFFSRCVFQSVQVVGASMQPTLHDADRYFLNRWAYFLHSPQHQDIVVLKDPTDGAFAVKRIIATPGEAIYFKKGQVYINGRPLTEPYLADGTRTFTYLKADEALVMCGQDQYFVLGDNRGNSFDSRVYGPVRRQNILGAIVR
jgi:signal peptidase I